MFRGERFGAVWHGSRSRHSAPDTSASYIHMPTLLLLCISAHARSTHTDLLLQPQPAALYMSHLNLLLSISSEQRVVRCCRLK